MKTASISITNFNHINSVSIPKTNVQKPETTQVAPNIAPMTVSSKVALAQMPNVNFGANHKPDDLSYYYNTRKDYPHNELEAIKYDLSVAANKSIERGNLKAAAEYKRINADICDRQGKHRGAYLLRDAAYKLENE